MAIKLKLEIMGSNSRDGLNVIEDVGGMTGYINFLKQLNEGSEQEKKEARKWAKSQGWTGIQS